MMKDKFRSPSPSRFFGSAGKESPKAQVYPCLLLLSLSTFACASRHYAFGTDDWVDSAATDSSESTTTSGSETVSDPTLSSKPNATDGSNSASTPKSSSTASDTSSNTIPTSSLDSDGDPDTSDKPDPSPYLEIIGYRQLGQHCKEPSQASVLLSKKDPMLGDDNFQLTASNAVLDNTNGRKAIECGIELDLRWPQDSRVVLRLQEEGFIEIAPQTFDTNITLEASWSFSHETKEHSTELVERIIAGNSLSKDYNNRWSAPELNAYSDCSGAGKLRILLQNSIPDRPLRGDFSVTIDSFYGYLRLADSNDDFVPACAP